MRAPPLADFDIADDPLDAVAIERSPEGTRRTCAEYQAVITRAICHLEPNTLQARQTLYVNAEARLVAELRELDPVPPRAVIDTERELLREAARRAEAEAALSEIELIIQDNDGAAEKTADHRRCGRRPAGRGRSSPTCDALFIVGRAAVVMTFIMSALFRLTDLDGVADMIASKLLPLSGPMASAAASIQAICGVPFAKLVAVCAVVLEIAAGLLVTMGIFCRSACLALMAFSAVAIYWSWDFHHAFRSDQMIDILNHLSVMGALLIVCTRAAAASQPPQLSSQ